MRVPGCKSALSLWPIIAITLLLTWAGVSLFVSSPLGWIGVVLLIVAALLLALRFRDFARLKHEASTDAKTGLWNARQFNALYAAELGRSRRFHRPMAVLMLDLDLLRDVNNKHGHLAGDAVLARIGQTLKTSVRGYDVVGRFGGEEFAVVLPEATAQQAFKLAERLRLSIAAARFLGTGGTAFQVTASFGVACFPDNGETAHELLEAADRALYAAKARGRNCTVAAVDASSTPHEAALAREHAAKSESLGLEEKPTRHLLLGHFVLSPVAVAAAACVALLATGLVTAAVTTRALPGDALYPLKLAAEQARVELTFDLSARALANLADAHERAKEIAALAQAGRAGSIPEAAGRYLAAREVALSVARVLRAEDSRWEELARRIETGLARDDMTLASLARDGPLALKLALSDLLHVVGAGGATGADTDSIALAGGRAGLETAASRPVVPESAGTDSDLALLDLSPAGEPVRIDATTPQAILIEYALGSVTREQDSRPDLVAAPALAAPPVEPPPSPALPKPKPAAVEPPPSPPDDGAKLRGNSANAPGHNKGTPPPNRGKGHLKDSEK